MPPILVHSKGNLHRERFSCRYRVIPQFADIPSGLCRNAVRQQHTFEDLHQSPTLAAIPCCTSVSAWLICVRKNCSISSGRVGYLVSLTSSQASRTSFFAASAWSFCSFSFFFSSCLRPRPGQLDFIYISKMYAIVVEIADRCAVCSRSILRKLTGQTLVILEVRTCACSDKSPCCY